MRKKSSFEDDMESNGDPSEWIGSNRVKAKNQTHEIKKLLKTWQDLADKNKNKCIELYDNKFRNVGFIEQGKDGFTEIILAGAYFNFTKVWLYPPVDGNGYVNAHGLLRKNSVKTRGVKYAKDEEKTN